MKIEYKEIPIEKIQVWDKNPNTMSKLVFEELKKQIEKYGMLGGIVVRKNGKGGYIIVDGEHRFLAAKELGQKKIPCYVVEMDEVDALVDSIRFNNLAGEIDKKELKEKIKEIEASIDSIRFNNLRGIPDRYLMALNIYELQKKYDKDKLRKVLVLDKCRYARFLKTIDIIKKFEKERKQFDNEVEKAIPKAVLITFILAYDEANFVRETLKEFDKDENKAIVKLCEFYQKKKKEKNQ